jgi:integrase
MPRARTGTLVPPGADGIHRARVTKTHADGSTTRPLYSLGTTDRALARRKLARLVALVESGADVLDAAEAVNAPERMNDYAEAWLAKREAQGIASVVDERGWLDRHVLPAIGKLPVCDVRPTHVRGILEEVTAKGLKRASVAHVRGVMKRLFRAAGEQELIDSDPTHFVRVPKMREVKKARAILTDAEFAKFIACPGADLELRMLSLVARCEGGMRTGDLNRWDWTQVDRVDFAECTIPRAKTGVPQVLAIPDVLAPFLRAWWERQGKPEAGPVFPARRGRRAGGFRLGRGASYAEPLRRDLLRAGVVRLPPVKDESDPKGERLRPNPADPLYFETATTLPVDFHSFRRAFNTALAEAGVNVQHAMHLAGHSDPHVHARYVMRTAAMRTIPVAALPRLPIGRLSSARRGQGNVTAGDDSFSGPPGLSMISVGHEGLEPSANGLRVRCSTN